MKRAIAAICFLAFGATYAFAAESEKGYARALTNAADIAKLSKGFEQDLRLLGLRAKVDSCRNAMEVAVGVVGGNTSHGAICELRIGKNDRTVTLCDDEMFGHFVLSDGGVVADDYITAFVRQNCYGG